MPHISIVSYSSNACILPEILCIYLYKSYVFVLSTEAMCIYVDWSQNVCFNNVTKDLVFVAHFPPHTGKRM